MTSARLDIDLPSPDATTDFAKRLAPLVRAGDVLLLAGDVGAGKTAFARALILALRARSGLPPEDVPSPTFTLVQTYDSGAFEVWHADLYRLTDSSEWVELGLDEAFATALCLIEWPDRLGPDAPDHAGHIALSVTSETGRHLTLHAPSALSSRLSPAFTDVPA